VGEETWAEVDAFAGGLLAPHDPALEEAIAAGEHAGLPQIQVSPPQGKLLNILARSIGARAVLEFGTLAGYSTIWLARALPEGDGSLVTLESDPDIRVAPALETLPSLEAEGAGPFDLVFIDADKVNTPEYFAWSLERTRLGGLIVADNVVRGGALVDRADEEPSIVAQRRFHEMLADEPRVEATTIQTVGVKGYDGFTIALVTQR
jgi:predicted O-methyltransferase YrrM